MYSAVLMLALTAGGETADFGRNRCNSGTTACAASHATHCSTGASACSARPKLFGNLGNRSHGCSASHSCSKTVVVAAAPVACSRSHGCSTSHGCTKSGGLFSKLFAGRGCSASHGHHHGCSAVVPTCSTGVIVKPAAKPLPEPVPPPKGKGAVSIPATIHVSVPAGARLIVDGVPTTSVSENRTLVTPALEVGATYFYTMQVEVVRDGRTVVQSQEVAVRGGETSTVAFQFSTQGVASR